MKWDEITAKLLTDFHRDLYYLGPLSEEIDHGSVDENSESGELVAQWEERVRRKKFCS